MILCLDKVSAIEKVPHEAMFAVMIGTPVQVFGECKKVNVLSNEISFLEVNVLLLGLSNTSS